MKPFTLDEFIRESNRIEGIHRKPTVAETEATLAFLALPAVGISDLVDLVAVYAPGHKPRFVAGLDVRVGNHYPPRGGPHIQGYLSQLLEDMTAKTAYAVHQEYETLHPFTDGNGRSGRALWLWQMGGISRAPLGFLHHWYYQSLQAQR